MGNFRILSFDGGGVRGLLTIDILCRLIDEGGYHNLLEQTELFAGTSVGSFLALGLATGISANNLAEIIENRAPKIFGDPKIGGPILTTKYSNRELIKAVKSILPSGLRMRDLDKKVVVPTFELADHKTKQWSPIILHNFPGSPYLDVPVVDAALYSSAAPTFLPEYKGYIDGGVVINNPSTAAITTTIGNTDLSLSEIILLSIGTGYFPSGIARDTSSWGAISSQNKPILSAPSWAIIPNTESISEPPLPLLSIMLNGSVAVHEIFSASLLGENYCRLNPILPKPIDVDDIASLSILRQVAKATNINKANSFVADRYLR